MNRDQEFDQTLARWLDDGADQAPERIVRAALEETERIAQRGARQALLEGLVMKLKRAAPYLGVAALIILAIAAYQLLAGANIGTAMPSPSPTITPRVVHSEDLASIVLPNVQDASTQTGSEALGALLVQGGPELPEARIPRTGFVDARGSFHQSLDGDYYAWAAVFQTAGEARQTYEFLVSTFDVKWTKGWNLGRSDLNPDLGDESVLYTGKTYDLRHVGLYLWRVNNAVLAAFKWNELAPLRTIAEEMDLRAR